MLEKKKYKRAEVEEIISRIKTEYDEIVGELKEKAELLSKENRTLSFKLSEYEKENSVISASIKAAEKKAEEIRSAAENEYLLTVSELKTFRDRFNSYFSYITEKYPHYEKVKSAKADFDRIARILGGTEDAKGKIAAAEKTIKPKKNVPFDPQSKINEYIASTGENGFNLDEVLNPGELHLEDLCKELGLTEEE